MIINKIFEPLFSDEMSDKRYYNVYGGRGSAKSFSTSVAMVGKTYSKHKHKILYLRQNMTSSGDSTVADVETAIEMLGAQDDFIFSKGTFKNKITGSTISFKGIKSNGNNTAKLKSLSGITIVVFEEAEEIESFLEFSKIDESIRMAGKPLKIILLYNPTSSIASWIHKEFFIDGKPNPDRFHDTCFLHSTYLDNLEHLAESTVKRYRDLEFSNPTYYIQTIMAEWTIEVEGRVYEGWGRTPHFPEGGKFWYALDFGYGGKDATSCVKIMFKDGVFYVKQLFNRPKMSINEISHYLRMANVSFNDMIICDSAAPILIEELRLKGWTKLRPAKKGQNSKEQGIKKIQGYEVIIVGESLNLYNSYMTFARNKQGETPHEPDILAALRYGLNYKRMSGSGNLVQGGGRVIPVRGYL